MSAREAIARAVICDWQTADEEYRDYVLDRAAAILAALDAAGVAVVPKEPTQSMINAAVEYTSYAADRVYPEDCVNIYHAMLAAAKEGEP
jgi:hypothetical protein